MGAKTFSKERGNKRQLIEGEWFAPVWATDHGQKTEKYYTGSHEVGWECFANICRIKFVIDRNQRNLQT